MGLNMGGGGEKCKKRRANVKLTQKFAH